MKLLLRSVKRMKTDLDRALNIYTVRFSLLHHCLECEMENDVGFCLFQEIMCIFLVQAFKKSWGL